LVEKALHNDRLLQEHKLGVHAEQNAEGTRERRLSGLHLKVVSQTSGFKKKQKQLPIPRILVRGGIDRLGLYVPWTTGIAQGSQYNNCASSTLTCHKVAQT
jgi:hypothetical protein